MSVPPRVGGKWVPVQKLTRVALTGLARKILLKAGVSGAVRKARGII
jgi:hypothetical protein